MVRNCYAQVLCTGTVPDSWHQSRALSAGGSSRGCLVRLRCASAGCILLRRSLSASSALSSSFVTILFLISSHSPGLSTAKVRKTWRSPPGSAVSDHPVGAWSNILTMVIGHLPLTFGASSWCLKYCSIHSRAGRSLSCRSAFPRKSNLLTMISRRLHKMVIIFSATGADGGPTGNYIGDYCQLGFITFRLPRTTD